jgi:hypothetical protein
MVWDKTIPDGSKKLHNIDDDLRANADALETALNTEHRFATGGTQDARHKFGVGADAARTAAIPSPTSGNLWLNDVQYATYGYYVGQVYDGAAWADLGPNDPDIVRHDEANNWTAGQASTYQTPTVTPGPPDQWDWSVNTGTYWHKLTTANVQLNNPTGALFTSGNGGYWMISILNDGVGSHAITFGSAYVPAWTSQPDLNPTASAYTFVHLTLRQDAKLVYTIEWV